MTHPHRPSRRILRRVMRLALLAILGFITTIGVAWGIEAVLWQTTRGASIKIDRSAQVMAINGLPWIVDTHRGIGWSTQFTSHPAPNSRGPVADPSQWAQGITDEFRKAKAEGDSVFVKVRVLPWTANSPSWGIMADPKRRWDPLYRDDSAGLPLSCLWKWSNQWSHGGLIWVTRPAGSNQSGLRPETRALPINPIPLGLAVDTVFWGCVWWLGLVGVGTIRRRRRARRGLCLKCAYDLRGIPTTTSPACPECGHAAPSPHRKDVGNAPSPDDWGGGGAGVTRSVTEGFE